MSAGKKATSPAVTLRSKVPDFELPSTSGANVRLKGLLGGTVVLYFYPRDNTPGCTLEGQQFAALQARFAKAGATVFGISRDSLASHQKFRQKMGYPFALLSDEDQRVCRLFDVIRQKNMYGRKVLGIERSTFLIDAKGVLRGEWRKVKVEGHAQEVLEAAQSL
jgi:peroxiredoxin Q/BCP